MKENDSILVENHTKCIGLRPTRPFSAYQTICASDLFPWQRNLEVVYSEMKMVGTMMTIQHSDVADIAHAISSRIAAYTFSTTARQ